MTKIRLSHIFFLIALVFTFVNLHAQKTIIKDVEELYNLSSSVTFFEDTTNQLKFSEVIERGQFETIKFDVPSFGVTKSTFWLKIDIENQIKESDFIINITHPTLDYVELFYQKEAEYLNTELGEHLVFDSRKYKEPNYLFDFSINKSQQKSIYLKVQSNEALQVPITLGTKSVIMTSLKYKDLLTGIYVGIMLVMIFYNLFIYITVRDISYVFYVIYILFILLTQTSLQGYTLQFIWPDLPVVSRYSLFIFPALSTVTGMTFMNIFLQTKKYFPKMYKLSFLFIIPLTVSIVLGFLGVNKASQVMMEATSGLVSAYMFSVSGLTIRKGFKPAKIFFIAWIVFLVGVFAFIMKDLGIIPFNNFTRYTMQIGSAIETILLSFALAAKINTYKKEMLDALKANEEMIKERNTYLELKVKERTEELNALLSDLKNTQSQLVEAEKMSSLGQLTAGIAHEINNPINFVSSNIYPLRQDISDLKEVIQKYEALNPEDDIKVKLEEIEALKVELDYDYLKEELDTIINGIEEGAKRTSKIVSGLKTFSRLDEGSLKDVNINDGIEATLVLINNKLNGVNLKTELGDIPTIECNPGKINQLFMNLIDNSIFAVQKKEINNEEGEVFINTSLTHDDKVKIIIKDNGIGIPEDIREKLFEPFFTTKSVGEGTGLGLSIVRSIIDDHQGVISVDSEVGVGTQIEIVLPQKKKSNG